MADIGYEEEDYTSQITGGTIRRILGLMRRTGSGRLHS